ncbi:hypothetical protein QL093DRAFT_2489486 [Fusarium oxysporum]|nr:hypothetical protein FOWG_17837 [Fusarium oxysporum f. sp. lycopersici MN25]KAJ9413735.1 hypothetical protein QL093DRAFT_2489486 [Fusarium oxysporum]
MNPALAMVLLYLTTASAEDWDQCRCMKYPSTGTPNDCATIKACGSGKHRAISIYKNGDIWCEKTDVAINGPEFYRTCYDLLQDPKPNSEADSCCIKGDRASDGCFK